MAESDHLAIARAKSDIVELDRKISVVTAEESRLATQRSGMESERERIRAFVEMYYRYTGTAEIEDVGDPPVPTHEAQDLNGAAIPPPAPPMARPIIQEPGVKRVKALTSRKSGKRRQPVHRKPKDAPTMNEMITLSLQDAQSRGAIGLEPKDMTEFIRQKWWPHVKGSAVGPIAWRMADQHKLRKIGDLYALPAF